MSYEPRDGPGVRRTSFAPSGSNLAMLALPKYARVERTLSGGDYGFPNLLPLAARIPALRRVATNERARSALLQNARVRICGNKRQGRIGASPPDHFRTPSRATNSRQGALLRQAWDRGTSYSEITPLTRHRIRSGARRSGLVNRGIARRRLGRRRAGRSSPARAARALSRSPAPARSLRSHGGSLAPASAPG